MTWSVAGGLVVQVNLVTVASVMTLMVLIAFNLFFSSAFWSGQYRFGNKDLAIRVLTLVIVIYVPYIAYVVVFGLDGLLAQLFCLIYITIPLFMFVYYFIQYCFSFWYPIWWVTARWMVPDKERRKQIESTSHSLFTCILKNRVCWNKNGFNSDRYIELQEKYDKRY